MKWNLPLSAFVVLEFIISAAALNNDKVTRNVAEEEPNGTIVANMARILSLRHNERAGKEFKILSQSLVTKRPNTMTLVNLIALDNRTGIMTLVEKIDREDLCKRAEECIIQVNAIILPNEHFSMMNLDLIINDINDNAPKFPEKKIDLTLNEGETHRNDIVNLDKYQATDDDLGLNGDITYTLTQNAYFSIAQYKDEAGTPHLGLTVLIAPDHEMESLYHLTIFATDHGEKSLADQASIHITIADANDHDPVFEQQEYPLYLRESTQISSTIATVHASDRDSGAFGRIQYFLARSAVVASEGLVSVDQYSGKVILTKKLRKDVHDGLRIMIEAHDSDPNKARVGKAWLRLYVEDVNDNDPVININFIAESRNRTGYVSESIGVKTYVAVISATDEDEGLNGRVEIQIRTFAKKKQTKNLLEVLDEFVLNSSGLLYTGRRLDRETYQQYIVEIKACDKGSPSRCADENVTIIVLDANDNSPVFGTPSQTVVTREDSKVGTVVTSVSATDADALYAPSLWLHESKIKRSHNGIITYSISGGDTNYFSIDKTSGYIHLRKTLDYETQNLWSLIVTATDGGVPNGRSTNCSVIVRVGDINDNRPVFINPNKNDTRVFATILSDQPIMIVKAYDRDNGINSKILYKILEEDGVSSGDARGPEGLFIINPASGSLRLNFSKSNLTKFLGWHTIVIRASDSAESPLSVTAIVHVKVIDEALPDPLSSAGFDAKFIVIVAVLAIASLVLLVLIAATLLRRRRKKQLQTDNCKTGKGRGRICMMFHKKGKEGVDFNKNVGANEAEENALNTEHFDRKKPNQRSDATLTGRPGGFSQGPTKRASSTSLSLPIVRSMDMDSGRGDSGSENDDFTNIDPGTRNQLQHHQLVQIPQSLSNSQDDADSSRTSELGPRCVESCREFGHSDYCWLPSPSDDSYRPPSLARNQLLRYSVTPPDSRLPFHYNCIDFEDRRVVDFQSDRPGDRYSTASTEYFQTLPAKTSDLFYHGYGSELETIDECVPLGVPFAGGPDTYDVDDVCSLTNFRLSTSVVPSILSPSHPPRPNLYYIGNSGYRRPEELDWEQVKYRTIPCLHREQYPNAHNFDAQYGTIIPPSEPLYEASCHDRSSPFTVGPSRIQQIIPATDGVFLHEQRSATHNTPIPQVHLQNLSSSSESASVVTDNYLDKDESLKDETSALMMNSTTSC